MVNAKVSNATFQGGSWRVRFQAYRETDSPYDDPYKSGWKRSSVSPTTGPSEWYRRWVIVAPIRAGAGTVDPTPTPTPRPEPDPAAAGGADARTFHGVLGEPLRGALASAASAGAEAPVQALAADAWSALRALSQSARNWTIPEVVSG